MTIFKKELRQGLKALLIWTFSIAFMLIICIIMFPEMKGQMNEVTDMFANMGSFSAAFGMDTLDFGTAIGFYGVECGNVLGLGGGFFAAFLGITILSKEESEKSAEFLLTHPICRTSVLTQKLCAALTELLAMNFIIVLVSILSFACVGENVACKAFFLLHLAYLLLQLELACICFGLSAFIKRGAVGIGLGIATLLYFLNLISNISEKANFLKYFTPFAYAEASDIINDGIISLPYLLLGVGYALLALAAGLIHYNKKDIS